MTVITFEGARLAEGNWRVSELKSLAGTFEPVLHSGRASGWTVATTEDGDPQFYLVGPGPDEDCIVALSRLGGIYVLEDGNGRVLCEHNSLTTVAEKALAFLKQSQAGLVARLALVWCTTRHALQDKLETVIGESEEVLTVVAPQLAALI